MKPSFDHNLLKEDLIMARDVIVAFLKSFGPAPRRIDLGENLHTRMRLNMVEAGPVKIIKNILVLIVALVLLLVVFIHADPFFKIICVAALVIFYGWMFSREIGEAIGKSAASKIQQGLHMLNLALKFIEPPKPKK